MNWLRLLVCLVRGNLLSLLILFFAEGQRRYIETFSAYARQFLGGLERPDVDKIEGLSPVIAIEQKPQTKNPRSTVGTVTELYDFLVYCLPEFQMLIP